MIEMVLAHADLARIRFGYSPAREVASSLRIIQDPGGQRMYRTWATDVRGRLARVDMDLLTTLVRTNLSMPSFVIPQATEPWTTMADDLEAVAATSPAYVRSELEACFGASLPAVLRPLYDDPVTHLPEVVEELRRYWHAAIEPVWPRLQALCMADVSLRMEQFAAGGVARVLGDLHPDITLEQDRLVIDKPHQCYQRLDLAGTGILLFPCVFTWHRPQVECCGIDRPSVTYPPRGLATFSDPAIEHPDPLGALMGRTRAALLALLEMPRTTTQLAEGLDLSPGTVSEHLTILKASALVSARRDGRRVLYQRTRVGTALLAAVRSGEITW